MRYLFRSAAVLAIAGAAFTPAAAQTTAPAPQGGGAAASPSSDAANAGTVTGEIVVTARKTEEKLRDIPATISAVSASSIAAQGPVVGTGDLLRAVPGVRFNNLEAPNLSEISIRGSGTERATGADSAVGLFVNGAYTGSSTLGGRNFKNIDYFDIDRVEVLEGPQGALYGRNAEYGVVNVVLAKPQFNTSGYINDSYTSSLDRNQLEAVANLAVNDDVAVRFGAESIGQSKGFYYNPDQNKYYDHEDGWIARGQIRFRHGPLDVNLLVDAQDLALPAFANIYDLPPGVIATLPKGYVGNRFIIPSNGLNDTEQKVQRGLLNASLDLGWGTLTSTTMVTNSVSLQHFGSPIDLGQETTFQSEGEIGAYPFADTYTRSTDRTFYQDLHLDGKALDGNLKWLAGAEFLIQHDGNGVQNTTNPCALKLGAGLCTGTPSGPACDLILKTSTSCPSPFPLAFGSVSETPQRFESGAVYGSLSYTIQRFTLDGELRYTNDDKEAAQFTNALYTGTQTAAPQQHKFSAGKLNYTFTLSYKLPGPWDDLLYVKTGSGYRAGGINGGIFNPNAPTPFQPVYRDEETTSYEGGFKGNVWSHIYVTLDGYYSQTDNAIVAINDGCTLLNACGVAATQFNINGGTVHAYGVEASVNGNFRVLDGNLNVTLSGANTHATYVDEPGGYVGLPIVGSSVAQTPIWTTAAIVNYERPIIDQVDGLLNVTWNEQSGGVQDAVTSAAPRIGLSSVSNLSLRAGVRWQKLETALFVQNLTDDSVQLLKFEQGSTIFATRYNQPRTVGVNVIYRW
jgi:iron complex outermembrane receptor protein